MALLSPWFALLSLLSPLPTGTDRRLRRTPYVTYALIGVNILVYLLTIHDPAATQRFGLTPKFPRPFQLFTSLFIHVGFWHLLWNMVFLGLFGPHVEDALGPMTFTALYFGGGIAAGLLHMAISLMLLAHGEGMLPMRRWSGHRARFRRSWPRLPCGSIGHKYACCGCPACCCRAGGGNWKSLPSPACCCG